MELVSFLTINQVEAESEFLLHLLLPLLAQRGGCEYEDPADPPAQKQLRENQTRFYSFSETDVVGQQKGYARHTQRMKQWDQLEVVNLNSSEERRRQAKFRSLA